MQLQASWFPILPTPYDKASPRPLPLQLASLLRTLQDQGAYPQRLQLLRFVLQQCSADKRVADIFQDRSMSSRFANLAKQHLKAGVRVWRDGR